MQRLHTIVIDQYYVAACNAPCCLNLHQRMTHDLVAVTTMTGTIKLVGVVNTMALLFKHGKREDLVDHGRKIKLS